MATEFSREFFADNRIVKAELRSARKPREEELNRIRAEVRKLYDATEVILNVTVDESLLSGYVLQVGDRVFDNSGRQNHQAEIIVFYKPMSHLLVRSFQMKHIPQDDQLPVIHLQHIC